MFLWLDAWMISRKRQDPLENRFLESTEWIKEKNISLQRFFKTPGNKNFAILLFELSLWKSRCKYLHIQLRKCCVFAGPRRKKRCFFGTIPSYISFVYTDDKLRFHGELKERLRIHSRLKLSELPASPFGSLESSFKALERKNYLLCAFPEFTSKISLVIFLHNWFTWGAMAQADNSELHSNVHEGAFGVFSWCVISC